MVSLDFALLWHSGARRWLLFGNKNYNMVFGKSFLCYEALLFLVLLRQRSYLQEKSTAFGLQMKHSLNKHVFTARSR